MTILIIAIATGFIVVAVIAGYIVGYSDGVEWHTYKHKQEPGEWTTSEAVRSLAHEALRQAQAGETEEGGFAIEE